MSRDTVAILLIILWCNMQKPLPLQSVNNSVTIATLEELQQLHATGPLGLVALNVRGAGIDFNLLADILRSNVTSLTILTINRGDGESKCSTVDSFLNFSSALQLCVNMDILAINNFRKEFRTYPDNLARAVCRLSKLRVLSFSNTFLGDWGRQFFVSLRYSSIKELHLVHALDRAMWYSYLHLLAEHATLEKLVLGNSAIKLEYLPYLIDVVTNVSTLKVLEWNPEVFHRNKAYYWINEHQYTAEHYRKLLMGETLDELQASDAAKYKQEQDQACLLLNEVQKFIEHRNGYRNMEVLIELPNERCVDFVLVGKTALLNRAVLQNLTIRMANIERHAPCISTRQFELFLEMLGQCQRLRSLKIEEFQNAFTPSMIRDLFKVLETLPIEDLSFSKTFIGPVGVQCLSSLCQKKKIGEIDLTLIGLIHRKSVEDLAKCIKASTSLRVITLGKSPLTIAWWQILADAARSNPNRPALQWQVTHEVAIKAKMEVLCTALYYGEEERFYARDISFDEFCKEIVNIELQWRELAQPTPPPAQAVGANGNGMEMQALNERDRLLPKVQIGYGATSGPRR